MVGSVQHKHLVRMREGHIQHLSMLTHLVHERIDDPVAPTRADLHETHKTQVGPMAVVLQVNGDLSHSCLFQMRRECMQLIERVDPRQRCIRLVKIERLWCPRLTNAVGRGRNGRLLNLNIIRIQTRITLCPILPLYCRVLRHVPRRIAPS